MNPFSNKKWKVKYNYGGGETYVYGDTEHEAKLNALALYRKNLTMLTNISAKNVIKSIIFIDEI